MKKTLISEVKKLQKIAGIIQENIEEAKEKTIRVPMRQAKLYDFDLEQFSNAAKEAGFDKYDGGIVGYEGSNNVDYGDDYQWAIAMGDDFPHALIIKNVQMLEDPQVAQFIQSMKSKG